MKFRILALALVLLVLTAGLAAAQTGILAALLPSTTMPHVNQPLTVATRLQVTDAALGSFSCSIGFDPTLLRYTGNSGMLGFTGVVNATQPGKLIFNGVNISGATGNLTVLNTTFVPLRPGYARLDLTCKVASEAKTFRNLLPFLTARGTAFWMRR